MDSTLRSRHSILEIHLLVLWQQFHRPFPPPRSRRRPRHTRQSTEAADAQGGRHDGSGECQDEEMGEGMVAAEEDQSQLGERAGEFA